jgi:phage shock protein A
VDREAAQRITELTKQITGLERAFEEMVDAVHEAEAKSAELRLKLEAITAPAPPQNIRRKE